MTIICSYVRGPVKYEQRTQPIAIPAITGAKDFNLKFPILLKTADDLSDIIILYYRFLSYTILVQFVRREGVEPVILYI